MSETNEQKMKRIGDAIKKLDEDREKLQAEFDLLVTQEITKVRNQDLPKGHSSDGNCPLPCPSIGGCYDCKRLQTCCHGKGTLSHIRHWYVSQYL
jgi:hypothetical protein